MLLNTPKIPQRLQHAQILAPSLVTPPHRTSRRRLAMLVQAASSADMALPEPLVYAKAVASVVARRATELMLDCASEAASSADMALPEPLVYAKAVASVVARRATELMLDCASEINVAIAEQPQRIKEFQEEVRTVAEKELKSSSQQGLLAASSSSSSNASSNSSSSSKLAGNRSAVDLATVVDELRADIAASRALLQQIRVSQQPDSLSSR